MYGSTELVSLSGARTAGIPRAPSETLASFSAAPPAVTLVAERTSTGSAPPQTWTTGSVQAGQVATVLSGFSLGRVHDHLYTF